VGQEQGVADRAADDEGADDAEVLQQQQGGEPDLPGADLEERFEDPVAAISVHRTEGPRR